MLERNSAALSPCGRRGCAVAFIFQINLQLSLISHRHIVLMTQVAEGKVEWYTMGFNTVLLNLF